MAKLVCYRKYCSCKLKFHCQIYMHEQSDICSFGKELFILFAASAFRKLSSIYVFSYFPFGFEGRIWDLIVSVPELLRAVHYCLPRCAFRKLSSIYVFSYFPFGFEGRIWDLIVSVPDHCLSFYFV